VMTGVADTGARTVMTGVAALVGTRLIGAPDGAREQAGTRARKPRRSSPVRRNTSRPMVTSRRFRRACRRRSSMRLFCED
jgi:hypothetical protein